MQVVQRVCRSAMTFHATFFVFLSLCSGAVTREYPLGVRRHPRFQRELGARPDIPTPSPLTQNPSSTFLVVGTSFPSVEPTVSPTGSYSPSSHPFSVFVPELSAQPTNSNASPQSTTPHPSVQPTIQNPSLPPVSIQIPTSNQAPESGSDNPIVDVEAVASRSGPQKKLSAAAITGVVLGFCGFCLMGLVSSRRRGRKGVELIE
jgi:hypothetical protein